MRVHVGAVCGNRPKGDSNSRLTPSLIRPYKALLGSVAVAVAVAFAVALLLLLLLGYL